MVLYDSKKILAYVHIEKAAGTTLSRILQSTFFMQFMTVSPLSKISHKVNNSYEHSFSSNDLRRSLYINPYLKCIAGHSVKPVPTRDDQIGNVPKLQYITLFRDPITRYISHYNYWVKVRGSSISFEEFLTLDTMCNFQTKKIAIVESLNDAIEVLNTRFLLVGVVERFDEFIFLLQNKLRPKRILPYYQIQNRAKNEGYGVSLLSRYKDRIIENNQIDIALYKYVNDAVLEKQRKEYGPSFEKDFVAYMNMKTNFSHNRIKETTALAVSNVYLVITWLVRLFSGLPPRGAYR